MYSGVPPVIESRAKLIARAFALPAALFFVMAVIGILGSSFGPREITYQTLHLVGAEQVDFVLLKSRIETLDAGDSRLRGIVLNAHGQKAEGCEGQLAALDIVLHGKLLDSGTHELYEALIREAHAAGLGPKCGGTRFNHGGAGGTDGQTWVEPLLLAPLALVILWFNWLSRRGRHPFRLNWADWHPRVKATMALRLGIGYAMVALLVAIGLGAFADLAGWLPEKSGMLPTLEQWPWLIFASLVAPIFEEFVYRAWLLERLTRVMRDWMALLVSTGAFVAIHFPSSVFEWLNLFLVGLVFGLLWLRTRSLLAVSVAHGLFNATLLTLQMMLSG